MTLPFLEQFAVCIGEHEYEASPFLIQQLRVEFKLPPVGPGGQIEFVTRDGEKYSVSQATVH